MNCRRSGSTTAQSIYIRSSFDGTRRHTYATIPIYLSSINIYLTYGNVSLCNLATLANIITEPPAKYGGTYSYRQSSTDINHLDVLSLQMLYNSCIYLISVLVSYFPLRVTCAQPCSIANSFIGRFRKIHKMMKYNINTITSVDCKDHICLIKGRHLNLVGILIQHRQYLNIEMWNGML